MDRDADGVSYETKGMIRCGMGFNLNGNWEIEQLFPKLQEMVRKYPVDFSGNEGQ